MVNKNSLSGLQRVAVPPPPPPPPPPPYSSVARKPFNQAIAKQRTVVNKKDNARYRFRNTMELRSTLIN
ncbi:unnamed protein product [Soboliphyme baturini]|uniref:WH2 domain-containing protein n=1 Tax=Soboliphyme baturini TaxID=241478 RepID=A0A183IKR1_9BILA|nr:unnamed protein product [Soboliphyme baturini]